MATTLKNTLIVLPAFNEEASVANVIQEILGCYPDANILVVDDGSTDNTYRIASATPATVLRLPINLGVGGAMRTGFIYALRSGYKAVIQVDADGQHEPRSIAKLIQELDNADIVIGARFAGQGNYRVTGPRAWAMKMLSASISRIAKVKLTDTTSGFRASGPRALDLFARNYPAEYLGDTIESLVIAIRSGLTIKQVSVSMRPRQGGVPSHNFLKSAIYLGRACFALVIALMRPSEKSTLSGGAR